MAIIFVEHDRPEPALYGAFAAIVARALGAEAMHLPAAFAGAEAVQHVTADGALVPSGLVWLERIAGAQVSAATTPAAILARTRLADMVVPLVGGRDQTMHRAALDSAGVTIEHIRVESRADGYRLVDRQGRPYLDGPPLTGDGFGRFVPAGEAPRSSPARRVRIGIVGRESDHRDVNPATLTALGDAAEAAGLALDVTFIVPGEVDADRASALAGELDGVLLPGGANMANVPTQILVAEAALRHVTPTVGLCLGMQTMSTAVMRRLGRTDANLAEVDPHAPLKTFVPLGGDVRHRLGAQVVVTMAGSRLHELLGAKGAIRSNHRFMLNPDLIGDLQAAGLVVTARDDSGAIAEGVELRGHPFYVGMQGHPELSSRRGAPHPLLTAFLDAAASRRA